VGRPRAYTEIVASIAIDDRLPDPHEQASRLYEAHSEWLLQYCLHQLRDHADAEDAVQVTFLYAFRALRRGVVPECERAWLTTIARNVCHEQRRTRQRRPETADVELDRIALARPDHEEVGFLDEVRAALAALPENQRRALLLREWQGLASSEIASELELSEPATHALLFRARRSFASALEASRRSVAGLGLNVAVALHQVRAWLATLLEGATVKAAVATTAAGVVAGGVVLEQRIESEKTRPSVHPASAAVVTPTRRAAVGPAVVAPEAKPGRTGASLRTKPPAGPGRRTPAPQTAGTSTVQPVAPADDTIDSSPLPPKPGTEHPAEPPASASPNPPAPGPVPPVPVPPVEPPPLPIDLPPILGGDPLPPIELPPPLDELVPPVELPPVEPPPLPPLLP
jgi:RNA polymerase sigma factor (sigma-70 family)